MDRRNFSPILIFTILPQAMVATCLILWFSSTWETTLTTTIFAALFRYIELYESTRTVKWYIGRIFALICLFQFDTNVEKVSLTHDEKWLVQARDLNTYEESEIYCDVLISGHGSVNWSYFMPKKHDTIFKLIFISYL